MNIYPASPNIVAEPGSLVSKSNPPFDAVGLLPISLHDMQSSISFFKTFESFSGLFRSRTFAVAALFWLLDGDDDMSDRVVGLLEDSVHRFMLVMLT